MRVENELQATVQQTLEIIVPGGIITNSSSLIALSGDEGKSWHFMDATTGDLAKIRTLFPNLSTDLVVIPMGEPVFYKD